MLVPPIDAEGQKQAVWRTNPEQAGASACVADIGTHAENLVDRTITLPERQDYASKPSRQRYASEDPV
jgi:hypothetical protein